MSVLRSHVYLRVYTRMGTYEVGIGSLALKHPNLIFFFEIISLMEPERTNSARPAGQQDLRTLWFLPLPCWDYSHTPVCQLLCVC